jgi:hypothetical protein
VRDRLAGLKANRHGAFLPLFLTEPTVPAQSEAAVLESTLERRSKAMKFLLPLAAAGAACLVLSPRPAHAHCDTLDGPVVRDARVALESKDVTPVLRWVRLDKEGEIREAFQHALTVRALGPDARTLADRFFFETLVRVHREGEGAPYTGLKPAGTAIDPGIAAADTALDTGSVDPLVKLLTGEVDRGLRQRYARAAAAHQHATESVEKGREYVAAYVEYVHYAERLLLSSTSPDSHAEPGEHAH